MAGKVTRIGAGVLALIVLGLLVHVRCMQEREDQDHSSSAVPAAHTQVTPLPGSDGPVAGDSPGANHVVPGSSFGAIRGRVVHQSTGTAAGRAEVTILDASAYRTNTLAGADGSFLAISIPPGHYLVAARADRQSNGYGHTEVDVFAGQETLVNLRLPRTTHLDGDVIDERGAPIPGAKVWFLTHVFTESGEAGFTAELTATSNASGAFSFPAVLPSNAPENLSNGKPKPYILSAEAAGHSRTSQRVLVAEESPNSVVLSLRRAGPPTTMQGMVVDALGRRVGQASVRVVLHLTNDKGEVRTRLNLAEEETLNDGTFRIEILDPPRNVGEALDVMVRIEHSGYPLWLQPMTLKAGEVNGGLTIQIPPQCHLNGSVVDETGVGISRCAVEVYLMGAGPSDRILLATDEAGAFDFDLAGEGMDYRMSFHSTGHSSYETHVRAPASHLLITLPTARGGR